MDLIKQGNEGVIQDQIAAQFRRAHKTSARSLSAR